MVDEKKKEPKGWAVKEVAVKTEPVLVNEESEERIDLYEAMARMMNAIEEMKKVMRG